MRNTTTGISYENYIKRLLETHTQYRVRCGVSIGKKRNDDDHKVDMVLNEKELVSLKYQKTKGTAEEKIPFEVIKLQHAIDDYGYKNATIVLAGEDDAWTLKEAYLRGEYINRIDSPDVRLISHEQFLQEYIGKDFVEVTRKTVNGKEISKWFSM